MRILFLNQYFPPDPAPTGVLFSEIAEELRSRHCEVEFIAAATSYRAAQKTGGRMRRELTGLGQILKGGLVAKRAQVVVCGTSPPLLLVAARLVAARHRARLYHWAMDLYPELALALGEIRPGLLARVCAALMNSCYRACEEVVSLDEDMAAHLEQSAGIRSTVLRPWVSTAISEALEGVSLSRPPQTGEFQWVYSGNLGRAHEWQTLLDAQSRLEAEGVNATLVFQGGGPGWPVAEAYAARLNLQRCQFQPYVSEQDLPGRLLEAHVLIATQKPEVRGYLWPSKLGLLMSLPRPILWVGPDGAVAAELRGRPNSGLFQPGQSAEVAAWIRGQVAGAALEEPTTGIPADYRRRALETWARLIGAK